MGAVRGRAALPVTVALALVLAACSGDDEPQAGASETSPAEVAAV